MKMISPLPGAWKFALALWEEQARGQLPGEQLCTACTLSGPLVPPSALRLPPQPARWPPTPGQQVGFEMVGMILD